MVMPIRFPITFRRHPSDHTAYTTVAVESPKECHSLEDAIARWQLMRKDSAAREARGDGAYSIMARDSDGVEYWFDEEAGTLKPKP